MSENFEQRSNNTQSYPHPTQAPYQPYANQGQPQMQNMNPYGNMAQQSGPIQQASPGGMLPIEQSYIENILRLNRGKVANVYMTFENNPEWNAKIFRGRIEAAGRDHIVLSDPETNQRFLLLMVYLDYVEFDEPIQYNYPIGNQGQMTTYAPR